MRAIVTGATGAIGMALLEELEKNHAEVMVLCHRGSLGNQRLQRFQGIKAVECDLNEMKELQNVDAEQYDVFFHLAWAGTTGEARNDVHIQNLNVGYALDALELAARFGCKTFLGTGSQAEYGLYAAKKKEKLNEKTSTEPETAYGMAKLCAGQMLHLRAEQLGITCVWLRILSVYGPYDGMQSMVMSCIDRLFRHEQTVFTAAKQEWDYLYSKDAAHAIYLLSLYAKRPVYCLGSGKTRELREYIEIIRDRIDSQADLGIGLLPYSEKQIMYLCADISALKEDTGFEPQFSFEKGIEETVEWYCKTYVE